MVIYADKCTITLTNIHPSNKKEMIDVIRRYYPKAIIHFVTSGGVSYPDRHPKGNKTTQGEQK
jgi:hypothetical protein